MSESCSEVFEESASWTDFRLFELHHQCQSVEIFIGRVFIFPLPRPQKVVHECWTQMGNLGKLFLILTLQFSTIHLYIFKFISLLSMDYNECSHKRSVCVFVCCQVGVKKIFTHHCRKSSALMTKVTESTDWMDCHIQSEGSLLPGAKTVLKICL